MSERIVVVSEFMDEVALERFGEDYAVIYDPTLVDDRPRLLKSIAQATALIVRNRTRVDVELLDAGKALKVVGRLGVGLDNIDLETCKRRDVAVYPATGANTLSVAEYVIAVSLVLVRRAYGSRDSMLAGQWPRDRLIGGEISGRTMGLFGFGGIARAVAERATALGMKVIAHDPVLDPRDPVWGTVERCDADALLAGSDVLSIHVPLTRDTRNLFGASRIGSMKAGAILVNTSRGHIVDEEALATALKTGKLGGAAVDVFSEEPLSSESALRFEGISNLILTPHIAGVTEEGNVRVSTVTVENVRRHLERDGV
jgi:(S)-sulfolactate dehydrogenase